MGKPIPPYVLRRQQENAAIMAKGQSILAAAVRRMSHLTNAERAEGERLIALPYGSEGYALRQFVLEHHQLEAA